MLKRFCWPASRDEVMPESALAQLIAETGWPRQVIETHICRRCGQGPRLLESATWLVHLPALEGLKLLIVSAVAAFHKKNPLVAGISKEELRDQVQASSEVFTAALETLVREKKLETAGEIVRLPGRGVVMKDEEAESQKVIEHAFASAGLKVPALKDVLAGLKVDKARAQKIVTLLLRDKVLVKISEDLVFHRDALLDLRKRLSVGEDEVAEDRRGPLQRLDRSKPEIRHPAAGISRPRARDAESGRRESNSVAKTRPRIFTDLHG